MGFLCFVLSFFSFQAEPTWLVIGWCSTSSSISFCHSSVVGALPPWYTGLQLVVMTKNWNPAIGIFTLYWPSFPICAIRSSHQYCVLASLSVMLLWHLNKSGSVYINTLLNALMHYCKYCKSALQWSKSSVLKWYFLCPRVWYFSALFVFIRNISCSGNCS